MPHENPFLSLVSYNDELPDAHKEQVMTTLNTAKFLLEFADLFTLRQIEVNTNILHTVLSTPQNHEWNRIL